MLSRNAGPSAPQGSEPGHVPIESGRMLAVEGPASDRISAPQRFDLGVAPTAVVVEDEHLGREHDLGARRARPIPEVPVFGGGIFAPDPNRTSKLPTSVKRRQRQDMLQPIMNATISSSDCTSTRW
jgi:hypothetical protein